MDYEKLTKELIKYGYSNDAAEIISGLVEDATNDGDDSYLNQSFNLSKIQNDWGEYTLQEAAEQYSIDISHCQSNAEILKTIQDELLKTNTFSTAFDNNKKILIQELA